MGDKIPLPKEFLPHPGDPVLPYRHWIRLFDNFIFMKNSFRGQGNEMTDPEMNRFMFTLLGFEGIRIFSSTPECDQMDTATHEHFQQAVKELFDTPVNPFKAYYDFESRNQLPSETTQEYLTALRSLMADCSFAGRENHHLAVRLACGCYNKDTQKKLLALPTVDLDEVLRIMKAEELANKCASAISATPVHRLNQRNHQGQHQQQQSDRRHQRHDSSSKTSPKPNCKNCGYANHPTKDPKCPANGQQCRKCGKIGHFSKVCRSKQRKVNHIAKVGAARAPFHHTVFLTSSRGPPVSLTAEVDTGSQISGVTQKFFNRHFCHLPLQPAVTLRNFDGTTLSETYGRFTTTVRHADRSAEIELHVLPSSCAAVIGQDIIQAMRLQIDGATMSVHSVSNSQSILNEFPKLVSDDVGTFPGYQHKIELTPDTVPQAQRLRPVPLARRDKVQTEVTAMEDMDIWESIDKSSWVHHMVTVPKADGGIRVTTDLSPLNKFVIPDRFPLPNPKDLFLELKGATVFSKLDLRKAFFHIELAPESRPLTTTLTHQGLRMYKRLPMGLKDSSSVCQRLVSQTLAGCPGTISYIDDIVIFGTSQVEHDANLRQALQRLEDKDFRLQLSKCEISVSEITFLGHIISASGVRPDPKNVDPIRNATTPRTPKQLASFLGMVNYYADFIPKLATVCEPLRCLLRKGVKFQWSNACQNAFNQLKTAITNGVRTFLFDPNAPTFVTVDASDVGLGAMLSQLQHGKEVPIAHASHTLQPRERAYAVNEKEALACVWACETWDKFLLGRHFTLRTDHASLTSLLASTSDSRKSAKFCRWIDRLAAFDFTIEYQAGNRNVVADALSRLSLKSTAPAISDPVHDATVRRLQEDSLSLATVQAATAADSTLSSVLLYVSTGWPARRHLNVKFTAFYSVKDELSTDEGYLLRGERIVVPPSLQKTLLTKAHDGHPGIVRMKRQLRRSYWWPGQDKAVETLVKHCAGCQQSDKSVAPTKVPTTTIPLPDKPWQKLAIDVTGPFLIAPQSSRFLVVLIDYHSKYPEVLMSSSVTSQKIIDWLTELFARYGAPDELVSDNGPQFVSESFTSFLRSYNVLHTRTSVYNPQENGCVERFNKYLKYGIQAFHSNSESWSTSIFSLLRNYRATPPTPDSKSPGELMFSRAMRLPYEIPRPQRTSPSVAKPTASTPQPQPQHNLRSRGPYRVGDKVMSRRPQVLKGQSPWSNPLTVVEVLGNWTYRLSDNQVWNARKMRRFLEPELQWIEASSASLGGAPAAPAVPPDAPRRSARENRGVPPLRYPP